jgi:predicted DNA-binding transcriptional regulator AlpA
MSPRKIPRIRLDYEPHALRLYSPSRVANLFEIDTSTLWRWREQGLMPKPITLPSGKKVWREPDLKSWLDELQADQAEA